MSIYGQSSWVYCVPVEFLILNHILTSMDNKARLVPALHAAVL